MRAGTADPKPKYLEQLFNKRPTQAQVLPARNKPCSSPYPNPCHTELEEQWRIYWVDNE